MAGCFPPADSYKDVLHRDCSTTQARARRRAPHDTGYCPVGFMFGIASVIGSLSAASATNISPAASSTG